MRLDCFMANPLLLSYWFAIVFYALAFSLRLLGRQKAEQLTGLAALVANGAFLILVRVQSGHWPLFNIFEAFPLVAFTLAALGLFAARSDERLPNIRIWVWLEVLLLLLITLPFPKNPSLFLYDHDNFYVVLFHALRPLALGVMLFSSAYFLQFREEQRKGNTDMALSHMGRNYLILSAALFLGAEYVGIVWCQKGWGDFWRWVGGFFQSTIIVLYLMLSFHLPGRGERAETVRAVVGGMSGFVMLVLVIIRSIPQ
jgi:hypothetical protein